MSVTVREAIGHYEEQARSMGKAQNYIDNQLSYLNRFAGFCPAGVRGITQQHVTRFFLSLPKTRASNNRALSALRTFFAFCEQARYVRPGTAAQILAGRKTQKFTRQPKYYIPVSQFGPMIEAAGIRHPVDRISLALAFYTLGRQGEIAGLRLKDLDLKAMTIRLYRPKRKRWTIVQICPELANELMRWLLCYAKETDSTNIHFLVEDHPDWYLAPALDCIRRHNESGVYDADKTEYALNPERQALRLERLVKRMLDIFGAQTEDGRKVRHKGEGMHTIRRSGARAMIDFLANEWGEDKALLMVSTMLDHETTTMTLLYIGRSLEQKRLNAYLQTGSMYGNHGRAEQSDMGLSVPRTDADGLGVLTGSPLGIGEVDAW